jgi:hypothetical protein
VGDAFATSCPAAGTGVDKVLTDVVRLCGEYIPSWLATPGMDESKIAAFYEDPEKRACDTDSAARAYYLRSLSTEAGLPWRTRRMVRYVGQVGIGAVRKARDHFAPRPPEALARNRQGIVAPSNRAAS